MVDFSEIVVEAQDESYFYGFPKNRVDTDHRMYRIDKTTGELETLDYLLWLFDGNDPAEKVSASTDEMVQYLEQRH